VAARARLFHDVMARALAEGALDAAARMGCMTVVLAGGCLANRRLDEGLVRHLQRGGVEVLRPRRLPVGDGAISVGQAFVALQRLRRRRSP
jgi:hydrogenase maturation protein HypF